MVNEDANINLQNAQNNINQVVPPAPTISAAPGKTKSIPYSDQKDSSTLLIHLFQPPPFPKILLQFRKQHSQNGSSKTLLSAMLSLPPSPSQSCLTSALPGRGKLYVLPCTISLQIPANPEFKISGSNWLPPSKVTNQSQNSSIPFRELPMPFESFLNRLVAHEEHLRQEQFASPSVMTANFAQSGIDPTYAQAFEAFYAQQSAKAPTNAASWRPQTHHYRPAPSPYVPAFQSNLPNFSSPPGLINSAAYGQPNIQMNHGPAQTVTQPVYQNNKSKGKNKKKRGCGFCDQLGHHVKICPRLAGISPTANVAQHGMGNGTGWLIDSGASHHVTSTAQNVSNATEYTGTDSLVIGSEYGNGLVSRYE